MDEACHGGARDWNRRAGSCLSSHTGQGSRLTALLPKALRTAAPLESHSPPLPHPHLGVDVLSLVPPV